MYFYSRVQLQLRKSMTETLNIDFNVYHNLPKTFGASLQEAVTSWSRRTKVYTAESLCNYIKSKNTMWNCWPEKEVPVKQCKKCQVYHIGNPSKCGCGGSKFSSVSYSHAPEAINLYKQ